MDNNIEEYISNALRYLCIYLKADEGTLSCDFVSNLRCSCKIYENIVKFPDLDQSISVFINEDYKYNNYYDAVLIQAVDSFCGVLYASYFPNKKKWFYNYKLHRYMNPQEFARYVHNEIQEVFLRPYSAMLGIDFEDLFLLSEMLYESDFTKGSIAFLMNDEQTQRVRFDDKMNVKFSQDELIEFSTDNLKYIRKLLAGAGNDNILLFVRNEESFICNGYISSKIPLSCIIEFEGRGTLVWKYGLNTIFRIKDRKMVCLQDKLEVYINELKEELALLEDSEIEKIIRSINEQKHGTSIVFMDMINPICKKRMEMLVKNHRAVKVDEVGSDTWNNNDNKSLSEMTRVDGATIIDINEGKGRIAYTNVIVDGFSILPGDYSSGARHNTITCFVDSIVNECRDAKISVLIFSESGSISLIRGSNRLNKLGEIDKSRL